MTDEEKKAIEEIKSFNQYNWEMNNLKEREFAKPYFDALDTVLNLIKKQSKEIEELKEKFSETYEYFKRDFTPNDKIKAKIESVDYSDYSKAERIAMKEVLQSLLEKEKILNRLFQKNN